MKKLVLVVGMTFFAASSAYAGICENALNSIQRRITTNDTKCKNSSAVDRLKARLATAKTASSKASVQRLLDKAVLKQDSYCKAAVKLQPSFDKLKNFCDNGGSRDRSTCRMRLSIRVRGTDGVSICRRKLWNTGASKCFVIEENIATTSAALSTATLPGASVFYSGQIDNGLYMINMGVEIMGVTKQEECK